MSTTRILNVVLRRLSSFPMIELEHSEEKIRNGGSSICNVKKVVGVTYSVNRANEPNPKPVPLTVVLSLKKTRTKIAEANDAQELLFKNKTAEEFRHVYLYHDENGNFISEYAPDTDLLQYIEDNENSLNLRDIIRLFGQLLSMVNDLHKKNMVHRDIKYENILLYRREGKIYLKLADLDEVISVDDLGLSINPCPAFITTKQCAPPEIKPFICNISIYSPQYRALNWKLVDSYTTGQLLYAMVLFLLKIEDRDKILKLVNDQVAWVDFKKGSDEDNIVDLITKLIMNPVSCRSHISEVINHNLFGQTNAEREKFFADLREDATFITRINDSEFKPSAVKINDASLLLNHDIKAIYLKTKELDEEDAACDQLLASDPNDNAKVTEKLEKLQLMKTHSQNLLTAVKASENSIKHQYYLFTTKQLEIDVKALVRKYDAAINNLMAIYVQNHNVPVHGALVAPLMSQLTAELNESLEKYNNEIVTREMWRNNQVSGELALSM